MSDQFPVFGPDGKLMGNLTSSFGIPSSPFTALPTLPAFPNFPGNTLSQVAPSISTGIAGTTPASNAPAGAATGTPSVSDKVAPASVWDSYLTRGAVIVLGFIFVAVGLTMFGVRTSAGREIVQNVRNGIPK